jgi:DNA-binding response OmpR family regulator
MTGKTILIIDDDQDLRLGLAAGLRGSGYGVICASDAVSGLTLAQKNTPDLIILDLGLPRDEAQSSCSVLEIPSKMTNSFWRQEPWPSSRSPLIIVSS